MFLDLKWFSAAAAAAAKSLQSCLTLCDPIDGSLPGSPVPGILQARTLEWVAIPLVGTIYIGLVFESIQTLCLLIGTFRPFISISMVVTDIYSYCHLVNGFGFVFS